MKYISLTSFLFFLNLTIGFSQTVSDSLTNKSTKANELTWKDYVKFNIQVGAVVNDSYCNKPYQDVPSNLEHINVYTYSKPGNSYTNMGLNVGFNFVLGKSPFVKHIVGINYVQSRGEYNYNYNYIFSDNNFIYTKGNSELNYKTVAHYINIVSGIRFTIFKNLHLEPCISFNINPYTNASINGLKTTQYYTDPVSYHTIKDSIPAYINKNTTVSFTPRISYDLKIKNQHFEIYASRNIAFKYRLPWWAFGITYYPFKKLR
jgi:hypothetical protein